MRKFALFIFAIVSAGVVCADVTYTKQKDGTYLKVETTVLPATDNVAHRDELIKDIAVIDAQMQESMAIISQANDAISSYQVFISSSQTKIASLQTLKDQKQTELNSK